MESKHPEAAPLAGDSPSESSTTLKTGRAGGRREKSAKAQKSSKLVPTVYACTVCRYQTVNRRSYQTHMATHGDIQSAAVVTEPSLANGAAVSQACSVLSSLADAASNLQVCAVIPSQGDVAAAVCAVLPEPPDVATVTQAYSVLSA